MLLGARQFFERRGAPTPSVPTARDYVQDGLVAMWDGIENAGWGVHEATSRTWVDLTGNNHDMSLDSSVTIGDDTVVFGASDQTGTFADVLLDSVVSVEFVYSTNVVRVLYAISFNSSGSQKFVAWRQAGKHLFFGNGAKNFLTEPTLHQSYHYDYSTTLLYVGGRELSSTGTGGSFNAKPAGINTYGGGYAMNGSFSSLRIYSRALTADEIAANYAIDKARFNLP
jgi:hypothetical protein